MIGLCKFLHLYDKNYVEKVHILALSDNKRSIKVQNDSRKHDFNLEGKNYGISAGN